ncbi:hypothetical protein QTP88_021857 [Uroleucon formosanum]
MLLIVVLGTAAACSLTLILGILYAGLTMILVITDVVRSPDVQFAVERYFPFAVPKIGRLIVSRSSSDFLDFGRRAIATLVVGTWFAVNLTFDCAFVVVDLLGPSRRPEERTPLESVGDGPTPNVPDHGLMPEESNGKPSAAKADTTENTYKYWKKRFTLFSMFDKGVLLDEESFYSVCPEVLSLYMAQKCGKIKVAIDPFCGAGGNVIQLAKIFDKVIAVDIDPEKILLAKQNSTIYGVFHKIEFIVADFFTMSDRIKGDVIVTSPPWGGPDYNRQLIIGPLQLSLNKVLAVAKTVAPKVLLHLPKNIDKFECLKMCNGIGAEVRKIENVFMDRYLNCTLLYVRSNNVNGLVERLHRPLKAALTAHRNLLWTRSLPTVLLALRSIIKPDLGCSPAEMVYGTTLRLPGEFFHSVQPEPRAPDLIRALKESMLMIRPTPGTDHSKRSIIVPE